MALRLKIESLRSRGELTTEERDKLLASLAGHQPAPQRRSFLTPLRLYLLGVMSGVAVAYLTWGLFS
jgi:hypothetical protein